MHDVVIIGGGQAARDVADAWMKDGLQVAIVEETSAKPEHWQGEWVQARGAVGASGLVVALDPKTADERRLLPCHAIVIATGRLQPGANSQRLLGITKLGAEFTPDLTQIKSDELGRTGAPGIFVAGDIASTPAPNLLQEVIQYFKTKTTATEAVTP